MALAPSLPPHLPCPCRQNAVPAVRLHWMPDCTPLPPILPHCAHPSACAITLQVADLSRRILYASQLDGWQLGKSRVFLRAGQLAQLEVSWRRGSSCRLGVACWCWLAAKSWGLCDCMVLCVQATQQAACVGCRARAAGALPLQPSGSRLPGGAWRRGASCGRRVRRYWQYRWALGATLSLPCSYQLPLQLSCTAPWWCALSGARCRQCHRRCNVHTQAGSRYLTHPCDALHLQAAWRGHQGRGAALLMRRDRAAVRVQATWRMHRQRSAFQLQRR